MKWVVLAIVVFVIVSTAIELRYRKTGPGHLPAEEARRRATAARLQEAGWEKLPVATRRPVEKPPAGEAAVNRGALGLGLGLDACFAERPPLLASIDRVSAPAAVDRGADYTAYFTASVRDQQYQLDDVVLLHRGRELVLVPRVEHLPGRELLSRWPDASYCASFPTASLAPGRYEVRLVASGPAAVWTLNVR